VLAGQNVLFSHRWNWRGCGRPAPDTGPIREQGPKNTAAQERVFLCKAGDTYETSLAEDVTFVECGDLGPNGFVIKDPGLCRLTEAAEDIDGFLSTTPNLVEDSLVVMDLSFEPPLVSLHGWLRANNCCCRSRCANARSTTSCTRGTSSRNCALSIHSC
jgi:hypothetical protein